MAVRTKVLGPYFDRSRRTDQRYRVRIEVRSAGKRTRRVESFATRSRAEARIAELRVHDPAREASVSELLTDYKSYLAGVRQLKKRAVETAIDKIGYLVGDQSLPIKSLTAQFLSERVEARLLEGRAVATVSGELNNLKTFLRWASKKDLVPHFVIKDLDDVRVEGRRKRGKLKLTVDESAQFLAVALSMLDAKPKHDGPLIAVLPLLCGVSGREILDRRVRDIDASGTRLNITSGKTEHRERVVELPEIIRPYVQRFTEGKSLTNVLFPSRSGGTHHNRYALEWTHKVCQTAKVTQVCPHGLRGTHATIARGAGVLAHVVAGQLGHGSQAVTERHYIDPNAKFVANQRTVLRVVGGGKNGG